MTAALIEASTASFRLLRTETDRRRPHTETDANGTLVYHDRNGRRWHVYDRRSSERRQNPVDGGGHRTFVDDAGEEWRVVMALADFLDESLAGLERQLARATKTE